MYPPWRGSHWGPRLREKECKNEKKQHRQSVQENHMAVCHPRSSKSGHAGCRVCCHVSVLSESGFFSFRFLPVLFRHHHRDMDCGKVCLFPSAWVYHKRRTDWRKFFRQVYNSGIARINLYKRYPDSLKIVHLLPAVFTAGILFFLLSSFICAWSLLPIGLFCLLIFCDSALRNKSIHIGCLSVVAAFIQLTGYGCGFLNAVWRRIVLRKPEFSAFGKTFYK